jgi:hypothetical protein
MAKETSPEERLLSLIKSKTKRAPAPASPAQKEAKHASPKADERLSGILKNEVFKNKLFSPPVLKRVNKYLIIILGLLFVYSIADLIFVRPYRDLKALLAKSASAAGAVPLKAAEKNDIVVKDYTAYSSAVPARTVFGPSRGVAEEVTTLEDMSQQIGLVGIIAGDSPQAIIENKKAQKTYYLNKGQSLDGYTVDDIQEDKVMLDYEGRKISLFL